MSCSCLDIKVPEVTEQGRMGYKLKMVAQTILSTNLLDVMLLHWSKNLKKHTNLKHCRCRWWGGWRDSVELVEIVPPADFLPCRWASFPLSKWGHLGKDAPLVPGTDPDIGLFCSVNWSPVHGLALPPLFGGKDWDKPTEWACARAN